MGPEVEGMLRGLQGARGSPQVRVSPWSALDLEEQAAWKRARSAMAPCTPRPIHPSPLDLPRQSRKLYPQMEF